MLVMADVVGDARVRREAASLASAGVEVHVVGLGDPHAAEVAIAEGVAVTTVGARSPFRSGRSRPADPVRRAGRWALLPTHRRAREQSFLEAAREAATTVPFDVVHAHDFPTLPLAAELAARRSVPLVYDSHECWLGRRREERPTPLEDRWIRAQEGSLGRQARTVLTVSDSLADWFRQQYGWRHVSVVRNSFPVGDGVPPVPPEEPRGLLYAGRIGRGRDLPTVAAAARRLPDFEVSLVGHAEQALLDTMDTSAVRVVGRVAIDDIDVLLGKAGLALVTLEDGPLNHRVALPNKLFQAVRAGVPVVAADLPELARVVREHGLGTLYRPGSVDSLVDAVRRASQQYPGLVEAVRAARPSLAWENDEQVLLERYADLATSSEVLR